MKQKVFRVLLLTALILCGITNSAFAGSEDYGNLERYVQWDDLEEVQSALKKNPKVINDNNGEILRMAVGLLRKPEIIKLLLDAGANPNLKQVNTDNNALHIVLEECKDGNQDHILAIVKMLTAKGADVNHKRAGDGYTPIHMAARNENVTKEIMSALLSAKNLNVNIKCNPINEFEDGAWTPLFFAVTRPNDFTGDNYAIVKMLIDKNADIKAVTSDKDPVIKQNWTALHLVADAKEDRSDIAKLLVEAGIPVDSVCKTKNMTPLHLALMSNKPEICKYLLSKGADIHSANSDGVTVLEHAKGWASNHHFESAKVIIEWAEKN